MAKKYTTSKDYRRLADDIWEKAKQMEVAGHAPLADILKGMSDNIHDAARKKSKEEEELKKLN